MSTVHHQRRTKSCKTEASVQISKSSITLIELDVLTTAPLPQRVLVAQAEHHPFTQNKIWITRNSHQTEVISDGPPRRHPPHRTLCQYQSEIRIDFLPPGVFRIVPNLANFISTPSAIIVASLCSNCKNLLRHQLSQWSYLNSLTYF